MLSVSPGSKTAREAAPRDPVRPGSDEDLLERRARGETMTQIAEDLGVSLSTISRRLKALRQAAA